MKEMWVALVELLTPASYSESGDTKCYTQVVAWAEDPEDYARTISALFEKSDTFVLGIEDCIMVSACSDPTDELAGQIERASTHPEDCIFGTLHYYPSKPE